MPYYLDNQHILSSLDETAYAGRFIHVSDEEADLLQAGTHHVVDEAVVPKPAPPEPTLEERKAMKLSELEASYSQAREYGVLVNIAGQDYRFRAQDDSIFKVMSGDSFAKKLIDRGMPLYSIALEPLEGSVSVNAEDYDDFSFAFGVATEELRGVYMYKMGQIKTTATIEELDAIEVGL